MANTQAIANSFRTEILTGKHALGTTVVRGATTADTFKAALYLVTATINATTTAYTATGELAGTGNYTTGGKNITNANAPAATGAVAYWTPSDSLIWTALTSSGAFDAVLFYNSTQGNAAVAVFTFGSQTVTGGNFTLTMPTNDATTGLIRLS